MARNYKRDYLRHQASIEWTQAGLKKSRIGRTLSPQQRMRLATHIFNEIAPAHAHALPVSRFIKEWSELVARTGIVADVPGRGRKSKLTPDLCKEIMFGEYESEGIVWHFSGGRVGHHVEVYVEVSGTTGLRSKYKVRILQDGVFSGDISPWKHSCAALKNIQPTFNNISNAGAGL